ncbi:MAG: MMPL family transporter, partial [Thermoplasmata archaeon]|nr:MMPL family transporter [Thermoplasmata archaeon]
GPILTKVIMDLLNESQIRSLIITIIVSLIVLTIVFWYKWRSFILGIITITPVIFCVLWTLGTMYLVDIPLNVMTITIASLTVGLGTTYGIHITHRFLEDIERHDTIDAACRSTVTHTGSALFGAAATTIAGFGLLVFALMPPIQQFGGITALTILYSFLSSVFILPTFLVLWAKWRLKREGGTNFINHNNKKGEKPRSKKKIAQ